MTLFTFSRKSPSPNTMPVLSLPLASSRSLLLSNSELCKHWGSRRLAGLSWALFCLPTIAHAGSIPLYSIRSERSARVSTQVHIHSGKRGLTSTGTYRGRCDRDAFRTKQHFPKPCEPCCFLRARVWISLTWWGQPAPHALSALVPQSELLNAQDRLSPGLGNYEPIIFLLVFGFRVIRSCKGFEGAILQSQEVLGHVFLPLEFSFSIHRN